MKKFKLKFVNEEGRTIEADFFKVSESGDGRALSFFVNGKNPPTDKPNLILFANAGFWEYVEEIQA